MTERIPDASMPEDLSEDQLQHVMSSVGRELGQVGSLKKSNLNDHLGSSASLSLSVLQTCQL